MPAPDLPLPPAPPTRNERLVTAGALALLYLGLQVSLLVVRAALAMLFPYGSCVAFAPHLLPLGVLTAGALLFGALLNDQGRRNLLVFAGAMLYFGLGVALVLT